jgi:hypothetical protein
MIPHLLALLIYLSSAFTSLPTPPHALYLAVVQIDHSDAGTEAKVLIKVFADDLESVLRAAYGEDCRRVAEEEFCRANGKLIETYFSEYFSCVIDGQKAGLTYQDARKETDVYWLNFSLKVPSTWKKINIRAPFFTEIFSAQSNIIHLLHGDDKRFARLIKENDSVQFEW